MKLLTKYPFWHLIYRYKKAYLAGVFSLVVVDVINVVLPLLIKAAIDAMGTKQVRSLVGAALFYLLLMFVQSVGRYLWRVYLMGASHQVARDLRVSLYQHLQKLPLKYYHEMHTGDLMSRSTNDVESVRLALGPGILVTVDACLMFLLIAPVMAFLSPKLTLLAFAFYPLVPFLTVRLGDKIDQLFESLQAKMAVLGSFAQEVFQGIRLIKSLVLEPSMENRFAILGRDYLKESRRLAKYQAIFSPSLSLITSLGTFLILMVGGIDVVEGAVTLGTFVAFQRFVVQLSWPMEAIGWAVTMNREGFAANRRLKSVFDVAPVTEKMGAPVASVGKHLFEIRKLRFGFSSGFSLEIDGLGIYPGKRIGVVGQVGSGKSTLLDLMIRLHEPPPGSMYWEGLDTLGISLYELRQKIASVEQQVFLFSESISHNVALGKTDQPKAEEVCAVLNLAAMENEVKGLREGYSTVLGERGVNLSGGQKQRIALARALFRRPKLLLLDDSFSSIDVHVERQIMDSLIKAESDFALCFASHRLNMMPQMDEVWVLERGKLVGRGTHPELMNSCPAYQALWEQGSDLGSPLMTAAWAVEQV